MKLIKEKTVPVVNMERLRFSIDGEGIRTLIILQGCPLRCKYCANDWAWNKQSKQLTTPMTGEELYQRVKADSLYYRATGGGLTFGGGEPACYSGWIRRFVEKYATEWSICVETSLSVPEKNVRQLIPVTDQFLVDIKSWDPEIYQAYTGKTIDQARRNLELLQKLCPEKVTVRIPLIPGFNTEEECEKTEAEMTSRGFRTERFTYRIFDRKNSF